MVAPAAATPPVQERWWPTTTIRRKYRSTARLVTYAHLLTAAPALSLNRDLGSALMNFGFDLPASTVAVKWTSPLLALSGHAIRACECLLVCKSARATVLSQKPPKTAGQECSNFLSLRQVCALY